eukprot:scaffold201222_cov18-Tisochrysis_lutea.AAC.1
MQPNQNVFSRPTSRPKHVSGQTSKLRLLFCSPKLVGRYSYETINHPSPPATEAKRCKSSPSPPPLEGNP